MEKNKITTYLLYAIGEIVLVVVGILIAVSIDDWNEDRKEKLQEAKFLNNLKLDLQTDTTNLNLMIADRKSKAESALTLLEMWKQHLQIEKK